MSAMTRVAVVSALAVSSAFLLDGVRPSRRIEARASTATVDIFPEDASININNANTSGDPLLMTYTWPDRQPANAIVMKFDLTGLPAGAIVEDATLRLALIDSDSAADAIYTISAHKIVGRNPVISRVTGYTADGVTKWTPNSTCYNAIPLAQADISPPYDVRPVDKVRGDKTWTLTAMVREWLADPASNTGVLLNSDALVARDRYRFFASVEHTNVALRPYLRITYSLPLGDLIPPVVALKSPLAGGLLSGPSRLEAVATDNVGVVGVQFHVDGAPYGAELTAAPYAVDFDTPAFPDGQHTLTAVARDAAGNTGTAAAVAVTTANGTIRLSPVDTSLNLDDKNYSTSPTLMAYTWPDNQVANAAVLKFDLSSLPAGAAIEEATLHLALLESDAMPEGTYTITAHKIVGRNPAIAAATGYSADGVTAWTPNACCHNGVPLAQADISLAYDTRAIDKAPGFKTWTITPLVQDWVADPTSNFGVLLNSDRTALRDRYRFFASMEHADPALQPYLHIRYSRPAEDTTPPVISGLAPSNLTPLSALVTWTTNEASDSQVEYGTTTAYGSVTPVQGTLVTAHAVLLTGLRDATQYYYRVRSRDAAGNTATSSGGTFRTPSAPDTAAPSVSLTAPGAGATVSGTITVAASAADNVGVAGVQFLLDGANLGAEDASAPYSAAWNTANVPDGRHTVTAVARDAAGNTSTSAAVVVDVSNVTVVTVSVAPQDTTLNVNATNYSAEPTLHTYTWPDQQVANGILMKFDLSALPARAVIQEATLQLALVESDAAADGAYTVSAHKVLGKNPIIALATGLTADGTTPWTPNACCHNGVPLAQADISPAYDARAVDKTPGFKAWTLTGMVQEWINEPAANFGMLLNSDASKPRDRYRAFASSEHADPGLRPLLRITYTTMPDSTPPSVSGVAVSGITASGATVNWSTNEPADSQVEYGTTTAYGGMTPVKPHLLTAHSASLIGLAPGTTYHYRVRSRDAAGNLGLSGTFSFITPAGDTTGPSVSITAPAAGATVSGAVTVSANATDNVGVAGVQFRLNGAALGVEDTVAPYSVSWNTAALADGSHVLTAVARDGAGNRTTSAAVAVTVSNPTPPPSSGWSNQPPGFTPWTDWAMDALTGSGWNINNVNGYATVVADASAPLSGAGVGQWRYPQGFSGGSAPATMYRSLPTSFNEGFVGVWWKPSNPWQGHSSNVNKIYFLLGGGCGHIIPVMYGPPGGPYQLRVAPEWGNWSWLTPNVNAVPITLGVWHKLELYFKNNGSSAPGVIRWWMDGVPIGEYNNVSFPSSGCFKEFQFSPTWGGVGGTKAQTDYFWFDHVYISLPSGTTDSTPPAVSLTSPSAAATVSGTVALSAAASDERGVAGVQFKVDGANVGIEDTSAPYTVSWDSRSVANGSHVVTAVARDAAGNRTTSAAITVTVSNLVGPVPPATTLFQEDFESADLATRGWYDSTNALLSSTERVSGSTTSIEYKFNPGATKPTGAATLRRKFTASDSVYLRYYVKYSANWVGSQKSYHPHEFHFLTTADGDWSGLSFTHLTAYVEQNGGTPLLGIQDGANVDQSRIGQNLTSVTENRGVAGCNGSSDGYRDNCYLGGSGYVNEKKWAAASRYFTDTAGPYYKNDWHLVEAYFKLNSIVGGKGVNDGVVQYWFDGQLVIDRRDVLLRTGANATMKFNQFVIAPYIGDGSPVTQSMWIDNLLVATARP